MRKSSHIAAFKASPVIAEWLENAPKEEVEQQLPRMQNLRKGVLGFLALLPTETVTFREYVCTVGEGEKLWKEYPVKRVCYTRELIAELFEMDGLIPFSFVIVDDAARELGLRLLQ